MAIVKKTYLKKLKSIKIHNKYFKKILIGIFFFSVLALLIYFSSLPEKYDIKIGDIAQEDIIAKKDIINIIATRKLRQSAADAVPKKYYLDHNATLESKNDVSSIFNETKDVKNLNYLNEQAKIEALKHVVSEELSLDTLTTILTIDDGKMRELETTVKAVIEKIMGDGVKEDSIDRAKSYIIEEFKDVKIAPDIKEAGVDIAISVIRPNMVYDREATEKLQQEAIEAIEPVKIAKNQVVLKKGTIITKEHMDLLKDAGLLAQDKGANINLLLGTIFLTLILEGILIFSIYFFNKSFFNNDIYLILLVIIILSTLVIAIGIKTISNYLIPIAAGSMLISILITPSIAMTSSFVMSIAIGIMLGNDFNIALMAFFSAITGVFCTAKVSQRSDLTKAGGIISIINTFLIAGIELLNNTIIIEILKQMPWGIVNGILSSVLAIGILPFFEHAFNVTTSVKLLELSNPNQPLLRKLMLDAPGTYHHSIIVGNLAEAAAEAIEADPLLARVGANYHDIGKIKRPYFFIENQLTSENPHDKLNPTLSALIITSHVKDGIEIAEEYNLPQCIIDFIAQHHGTTLLSFFYDRAVKNSEDKAPEESAFRYEGPKPQTREVAIVMLADSSEAAVRSMVKPTPGKIEGMVRQIIKQKLSDGQLDECDLTLKDLDNIAGAFSRALTGIFHTRIEYPDRLKELERRGEKDVRNNNRQSTKQDKS